VRPGISIDAVPRVLRGAAPLPAGELSLGRALTYLSPEDHGDARSVEEVLAARVCRDPEKVRVHRIQILGNYAGEAALVAVTFTTKSVREVASQVD
jgi:hypothetical protein